jgi:hypothetical protein
VTSGNRELQPSISATLAALELEPCDSAASQLIVRYGQQLDDAIWAERAADKVLDRVLGGGVRDVGGHILPDDLDDWTDDERATLREEVTALRAKLAARTAVADLGPKLLAALSEVGATPRARAQIAKMTPQGAPVSGASWLSDMQKRHRA